MVTVSGLDGVVAAETLLSLVDGQKGHLVIRGHWAKDLAVRFRYEDVVYLLWNGTLPSPEQSEEFRSRLADRRAISDELKAFIRAIPKNTSPMSALRTCVSALGSDAMTYPPNQEQAMEILAKAPTMIAYFYRLQQGKSGIDPNPELSHAENFLYMLFGEKPLPAHGRALDAYFILTCEHGMNASTFSARVTVSTRSDLVSALTTAIGTMKGPLHGGAPSEVTEMLEKIGSLDRAESYIRGELEKGERLMGFGHRVYKTQDPRAAALREVATELAQEDPLFELAVEVEKIALRLLAEFKPGRQLNVNVEYYAAVVLRAVKLPPALYTPAFSLSRIAGWSANVLEQVPINRLIRPNSKYIGEMPSS